jgi:hypothetical protein
MDGASSLGSAAAGWDGPAADLVAGGVLQLWRIVADLDDAGQKRKRWVPRQGMPLWRLRVACQLPSTDMGIWSPPCSLTPRLDERKPLVALRLKDWVEVGKVRDGFQCPLRDKLIDFSLFDGPVASAKGRWCQASPFTLST